MSLSVDMHSNVKEEVALTSQTIATDTTTYGADVDVTGFESCEFILLSGTITDGAYAVSLVAGAAATPTTAVPAAEQLGDADFALADDDTAKRIGYIGKEPIVRLKIVSTATSSGGVFAAVAVLGNPHHAPIAD